MTATEAPVPADPIEAELEAVARDCRAIARRIAHVTAIAFRTQILDSRPFTSARIRRYLRARRLRDELLPAELFADPAWDMLLDLYASELEGRPVSVSSACIAAAVPPTTALRWLGRLEELGLVDREDDSNDCRRTFVHLTDTGRFGIERWLSQAPWLAAETESTRPAA